MITKNIQSFRGVVATIGVVNILAQQSLDASHPSTNKKLPIISFTSPSFLDCIPFFFQMICTLYGVDPNFILTEETRHNHQLPDFFTSFKAAD
jgi:hypothetical protein